MRAPATGPPSGARTPSPDYPFEAYCIVAEERGLDLTPLRLEVLSALWRSNEPMGAYDIVRELARAGFLKGYPNSVYRTLDTLIEAGLVVSIVSWKRFIISPDPSQLLWAINLCDRCGSRGCLPMQKVSDQIVYTAARERFQVDRIHIECIGICRDCAEDSDTLPTDRSCRSIQDRRPD